MKRRRFIQYTLAGIVTLPFTALIANSSAPETIRFPQSLASITNEKEVVEIGKLYRELFPIESNYSSLKRTAEADSTTALKIKIEKDYEAGRIITLKGWVLSITEARQCALYSLAVG